MCLTCLPNSYIIFQAQIRFDHVALDLFLRQLKFHRRFKIQHAYQSKFHFEYKAWKKYPEMALHLLFLHVHILNITIKKLRE